jgi:hypothetical protein
MNAVYYADLERLCIFCVLVLKHVFCRLGCETDATVQGYHPSLLHQGIVHCTVSSYQFDTL